MADKDHGRPATAGAVEERFSDLAVGLEDMSRLADSILAQPGASPGPAQPVLYGEFLRGETTSAENRAVVLELLKRAGRRSEGER